VEELGVAISDEDELTEYELEVRVKDDDDDTTAELGEALLRDEGALREAEDLLMLTIEEVMIGFLEQEVVGCCREEEDDTSLHLPAPGWHPCPQ
jgi:hypothetical protein